MATSSGGVATHVSLRIIAGVIFCAAIGLGIIGFAARSRSPRATAESSRATADAPRKSPASLAVSTLDPLSLIASFPDPNAPGTSKGVFLDSVRFDTGVYSTAAEFTGPARRDEELAGRALAVNPEGRYGRGMAESGGQGPIASRSPRRPPANRRSRLSKSGGTSPSPRCTRGNFTKATPWLERALGQAEPGAQAVPSPDRASVAPCCWGSSPFGAARVENCVECCGPSRLYPSRKSRKK